MASHGNSRVWAEARGQKPSRDLRDAVHPYSPASVRAVALGASLRNWRNPRPEPRLEQTNSKSQPPHLVLDSHNNCHNNQNLSFDHLLSGVIAD